MSPRAVGSTAVLILAGGRGERLDLLTSQRAKPAVPFGGSFRIIDFVLSNCFHSGLSEVSILTQYLPRSLEDHMGLGRDWDLDRVTHGLSYLHPFRGLDRSNWYGGTANALYENLRYLEESEAQHFLVLSGDHIYRMDYRELVAQHEESEAQVTVAVRPVPLEQAHHFGIFEQDESGRALGFAEKPSEPKSNLASMGVYVISRDCLLETLHSRGPKEPQLDFGHDLVPDWLESARFNLYSFEGYWLDVGTLESYYGAHMDLLSSSPVFRLDDTDWPVITRSAQWPPLHVTYSSALADSLVSEGCHIQGRIEHSILGPGVVVEEGALVQDSILMEGVVLGRGCHVTRSIIDKRVQLGERCMVGGRGEGEPNRERSTQHRSGLTLLAKDSRVPAGFHLGRNVRWALEDNAEAASRYDDGQVSDGESVLP